MNPLHLLFPEARLKGLLVLCLMLPLVACGPSGTSPRPRMPNIILILADDLGARDLGCYGSNFYETPNIDALAARGMQFTSAYSACPVCSPTRGAIMTGRSPARTGLTGHINPTGRHRYPPDGPIIPPDDFNFLPLEEETIAEALVPLGYNTLFVGKWHLGGDEKYWPEHQGFQSTVGLMPGGRKDAPLHHYTYHYPYFDRTRSPDFEIPGMEGGSSGEYLTDRLTEETVQWLTTYKSEHPFFIYLSHYAVHSPYEGQDHLVEKYQAKLETDSSQFSPDYAAMIESLDSSVGRIVETLHRRGLQDNTLIIFASDNGGEPLTDNSPLREGKSYLYEGGIRVPLIVRWPGKVAEGSSSDVPTISEDLYPTIVEIVGGISVSQELDGTSLVPALTGASTQSRALHWYYPHYSRADRPGAAIRDGDFKLIENYDPAGLELFNLSEDPSESTDLSAEMEEKALHLKAQLDAWLDSVNARLHRPNPGE
jgi:arylsulfatase A-like enzyme